MDFSGKTVLVTGASRGIGRSIAATFAGLGADIIVHCLNNMKAAEQTIKEIDTGRHMIVKADLSDMNDVKFLVKESFDAYGQVDILVNNAGIFSPKKLTETGNEEWMDIWEKTIRTNLTAPAYLSFLWARRMIDLEKPGKIINISSRGAFRGEPDAIAYGASKSGMNAMGQSMALALAEFGISVFTVAPGFVETEMSKQMLDSEKGDAIRKQSPFGRVAKPEEVARAVMLLASDGTDFMTGTIVDVNGASYLRM
ncbi:MAG: SDR family oxidoreductase [Bacteroidota bacterium]